MKERMTTLNEDKGKVISDLEALLIVMERLLTAKLEQKPNAGITLAKGQPNERKFSYKEAKKVLSALAQYAGVKGMISIGICQTCTHFDSRAYDTRTMGTCSLSRKTVHCFDTCSCHSKEGGGFGV